MHNDARYYLALHLLQAGFPAGFHLLGGGELKDFGGGGGSSLEVGGSG